MRPAVVRLLCLVGVSLFGAAAARADLKVGSYAPDFDRDAIKSWLNTEDGQAISLSERRGMIVMLFFWSTWDETGDELIKLITLLNSSSFGAPNGVYTIGLTDAEQSRVEKMLKKEKVFFPVGFEAKKVFEEYEIKDPPRVVVIDPNGKIAWTGWAAQGDEAIMEQLSKVALATPPSRTHPALEAKVRAYLKEARQALREDNFIPAYEAAQKAYDNALRGDALKTRCQDLLDLIDALGRDKLAQADRALAERSFEDGVTILLEIRRQFRGMEVALTARKRLEAQRKKRKEVAEIITRVEAGGEAETLLASALDELREAAGKHPTEGDILRRKIGGAHAVLEEIITEYAATGTAGKAQTVLNRIAKNDALMAYVRDFKAERQCRNLLAQADAYRQTGRAGKARELYREIIDKYGDTIWSTEAEERLSRMP